jgi:hypothetical protein
MIRLFFYAFKPHCFDTIEDRVEGDIYFPDLTGTKTPEPKS